MTPLPSPTPTGPRSGRTRRRRARRLVAGTALAGLLAAGVTPVVDLLGAPAAVAALPATAIGDLPGSGTPADPVLIGSPADLDAAAAAVNADPTTHAGKSYALSGDIDYANGHFVGFTTFSGTFDGAGHVISNVIYDNASNAAAFFHTLDRAEVRDLTLSHVRAASATGDGHAAAVAVNAHSSRVLRVTVMESSIMLGAGGAVNTQAGGLVASAWGTTRAGASGRTEISDNMLWRTKVQGHKYVGGLVGYPRGSAGNPVLIEDNLLLETEVFSDSGGSGATAGGLTAQGAAGHFRAEGNVLRGGTVRRSGSGTAAGLGGATAAANFGPDNLVSTSTSVRTGSVPGTEGRPATTTPATEPDLPDLTRQETHETLGWSFDTEQADHGWRWEPNLAHPVPRDARLSEIRRAGVVGEGTSTDPYLVRATSDLRVIADAVNAAPTKLAGVHLTLESDLDFGGEEFTGLDVLAGTLDGNGHTISNVQLVPSTSSTDVALVRDLTGVVRDLRLVGVQARGEGGRTAAVAATARGRAAVTKVEILDADLQGTGTTGGLVALAEDDSRLHDNALDVTVAGVDAVGGVVADLAGNASVRDTFVRASVTGSGAHTATGGTVGRITSADARTERTVLRSGSVQADASAAARTGRVVGTAADGWAGENLALATVRVSGQPVPGGATDARHGQSRSEESLRDKQTYLGLDWDFTQYWRWNAAQAEPRIKYAAALMAPNRITATFHGDPSTRRAFTWYQDGEGLHPQVVVSTDPTFPTAATRRVDASGELSEDGEQLFRGVLSDLTPATTYHYRVGDGSGEVWSPAGTFVTAAAEPEAFTFLDITDTQAKGVAEAERSAATLSKALKASPEAEFVVHNGDVVQGMVPDDQLEDDWRDLLGASQKSLLSTTFAPVSGNHDDAKNRFVDHFTLDTEPEQDTTTGAWYSYTYNGVHFMMLNTNDGGDLGVSDAQVEWLRRDAAAARKAGADWLVLTMHKGAYTASNHANDVDVVALRDRLVPLIDEFDIDLVLQGHDHYFSRSRPLVSDPNGVAGARAVDGDVITEVVGGVHLDYQVDPEGTVYVLPNTAGAKKYGQVTSSDVFDLEQYLQLFDRLGSLRRPVSETFLEVGVTRQRMTLKRYEIVGQGQPVLAEGFGIDRQVSSVDAQLAALPEASAVTLADESAVTAARTVVKSLTKAQRQHLAHLGRLTAAEQALRVLRGTESVDGSTVAWADPAATSRRAVVVRNEQRRAFSDAPVRVVLPDTPDVAASSLAVTTAGSAPVSFEVESWQPGGSSVVWVKVPELARRSTSTLWFYLGGDGAPDNDPRDVWSAGFGLVEHFNSDVGAGDTRRDSSGRATGTLVGRPLSSAYRPNGAGESEFTGSRLQFPGDLGGNSRKLSISALYTMTPEQAAALPRDSAVVARQGAGDVAPIFRLGTARGSGRAQTAIGTTAAVSEVPLDGEQHLVSVLYDGMTYAVFVDGEQVSEQMAEAKMTASDRSVMTTIGDLAVDAGAPDALVSPFAGTLDEVWVATEAFTPEFEAFRADNYFGDAVLVGPAQVRAEGALGLTLGAPGQGAEVEAGVHDIAGNLTHRADLVVEVDGDVVLSQRTDAGTFTLPVPVNATGPEVQVSFTATDVLDPTRTVREKLVLAVSDTTAPADPATSDRRSGQGPLTLRVEPQARDRERVQAQFWANTSVPLDQDNTVVRTGTTTDRVPTALRPTSGRVSAEPLPTTVGEDENPFQIHTVTLTPEQAARGEWHMSWRGTGDTRRVSAWWWHPEREEWVLAESKANSAGGPVNLDVRVTADDGAIAADRTVSVLVWRGLTELPWGDGHDHTGFADPADYDWSFNHVGDTQLYSEATPWTMHEQFDHIADHAAERKTKMVVQAGDWVNREEHEDEWQWVDADPAARSLERADIPFLVSWGNHDYNETRNGRQMLPKYFPMQRFEDSLAGSPWTFGGSHDIDNFYYTGEVSGAKLMWLSVGYWSANADTDPGLAWAQEVIAAHPDHTVILSTHDYLVASTPGYSNPRINTMLVDPYPNVRLVLAGHNSGTLVTTRDVSGARSYGILSDYQTRAWGGHGYLKNLSVDAENGLLRVNTWSPWLQRSSSDGRWNSPISPDDVAGFHGEDAENYVLEVDFGGVQTRTLDTDRVTFSVGAPQAVGAPQTLVGDQAGEVPFSPELGVTQEWFVTLQDASGNQVTSRTRTVRRMTEFPISYDLAGGEGAANPTTYTADDPDLSLQAPTRTGYRFAGWTGTGLTAPTVEVTVPTGSTGPRAYTAVWERTDFRITWDLAGGTVSRVLPESYHVETPDLVLPTPTRAGHTFEGWVGTGLTVPTHEVTVPRGSTGDRAWTAVWRVEDGTDAATRVDVPALVRTAHGASARIDVRVLADGVAVGEVQGTVVASTTGGSWSVPVRDGVATVEVPGGLTPGSHVLSVTFTGGRGLAPAHSTAELSVGRAAGPRLTLTKLKAKGTGTEKGAGKGKVRVRVTVGTTDGTRATGAVQVRATRGGKSVTRRVPARAGSTVVTLPRPGRKKPWTVRATFAGDAQHTATSSGSVKVRR